jgi:hypothetical protein
MKVIAATGIIAIVCLWTYIELIAIKVGVSQHWIIGISIPGLSASIILFTTWLEQTFLNKK